MARPVVSDLGEGWTTIPLNTATWTGGAQGVVAPRCRKLGDVVFVEGAATNSVGAFAFSSPTNRIGTLPTGYRPTSPIVADVYHFDNSNGNRIITVIVQTNGDIIVANPSSGTGFTVTVSGAAGSQVMLALPPFQAA